MNRYRYRADLLKAVLDATEKSAHVQDQSSGLAEGKVNIVRFILELTEHQLSLVAGGMKLSCSSFVISKL